MPRLSHNELVNLVENAFEAIGMRPGERAEAAEAIAWLETHSLKGVEELSKAIRYMRVEATGRLEERYRGSGLRVFSAGGQSILSSGALAVDAVLALASRCGTATVHVEDCHNRALITGFMGRAANHHKSVLACWSNRHGSQLYSAWFNGVDDFPRIRIETKPQSEASDQSITLIASEALELHPHISSPADAKRIVYVSDRDAMQRAHQNVLNEGLVLSGETWHTLKTLAAGVLVDDGRP